MKIKTREITAKHLGTVSSNLGTVNKFDITFGTKKRNLTFPHISGMSYIQDREELTDYELLSAVSQFIDKLKKLSKSETHVDFAKKCLSKFDNSEREFEKWSALKSEAEVIMGDWTRVKKLKKDVENLMKEL